jgi:hypothetical protein
MKTNYPAIYGSLIFAALLLASTSAQAFHGGGGRHERMGTTDRSGSYSSLRGGNGTFNSTVTRQPGSTTGNTAWTNQNGGQGSHSFNNTYANTGNGAGTGTHESSTTYADGGTSSSQGTFDRTSPGNSTYTGTHTGVNGDVTDVSKTATTSDGVRTVDSTYDNTTTGKTSTVDKTIDTNANGSKQVDTTATGPNGKSVTSDQNYTQEGNGYSKTGTVTGPNGNTATDNKDVTFTNDGNGEVTRTATGAVTGPNGNTKLTGNTETWTKTYTPNPAPTTTVPPQD